MKHLVSKHLIILSIEYQLLLIAFLVELEKCLK